MLVWGAALLGCSLVVWAIVAHWRSVDQPRATVIEPLDGLIKNWLVARFDGRSDVKKFLAIFHQAHLSSQLDLDQALASLPNSVDKSGPALEESQSLGAWGQRRLISWSRNRYSIAVGPIADLAPVIKYASAEKDKFGTQALKNLTSQEQTAGKNGFLSLAVAVRSLPTDTKNESDHTYIGSVVLEPVIEPKAAKRISQLLKKNRLFFLSGLNASLLGHLIAQLNLPKGPVLDAGELAELSLKEKDQLIGHAQAVGGADHDLKYWAQKTWAQVYSLEKF